MAASEFLGKLRATKGARAPFFEDHIVDGSNHLATWDDKHVARKSNVPMSFTRPHECTSHYRSDFLPYDLKGLRVCAIGQ